MIETLLILILGLGIFTLSYEKMKDFYKIIISNVLLWADGFKSIGSVELKNHDKYWNHLKMILHLSLGLGSDRSVIFLVAISTFVGSVVMTVLSGLISNTLAILAGITFFALPYIILRLILQGIRVRSSKEGEIFLGELSDNYKINYYNMQKAIEVTAENIENAPNIKRILLNLSRGLNRVGSFDEIRHLVDEFVLSIDTFWAKILGNNIYFSLTQGIRVDLALDELQKTITRARKLDELQKRQNNESKLILRYLVPASYVLTIFSAVNIFDLTLNRFIYYQFETEAGLTWITISLISFVISVLSEKFIARTKLDF